MIVFANVALCIIPLGKYISLKGGNEWVSHPGLARPKVGTRPDERQQSERAIVVNYLRSHGLSNEGDLHMDSNIVL